MTTRTITAAGAASSVNGTDKVPAMQGGTPKFITPAQIKTYMEANLLDLLEQDVATAAASLSIDLSLGFYIILTLNQTVTSLAFTNLRANHNVNKIILEVRNTGAFNITSWAGAIWPGGTAPTVTSGSGKKDIYSIVSGDGGTTKYGNVIGQDYH